MVVYGGFAVGFDGVGFGVDGLVVADVGIGGDAVVAGWGEELLLEGDSAGGVDPDCDVGEHVSGAGVFGDEIEFAGFDLLLAVAEGFGTEVGDRPGFGEFAAAASEA